MARNGAWVWLGLALASPACGGVVTPPPGASTDAGDAGDATSDAVEPIDSTGSVDSTGPIDSTAVPSDTGPITEDSSVHPGPIVQVAGGNVHTCALASDGTVFCWGYDNDGELGDGAPTVFRTRPVRVLAAPGVPLSSIVEIATGGYHTCARKADGTVWCWGRNGEGQVGAPEMSLIPHAVPVLVLTSKGGPPPRDVVQLAAGYTYTCARKKDGTAFCWGYNGDGQLGDGLFETEAQRPWPAPVLGSTGVPLTGVAQIAAGMKHTCAVKVDGTVVCWGQNDSGQLGDGTMAEPATLVRRFPAPVLVSAGGPALSGVAEVSLGQRQTCARTVAGAVLCWGADDATSPVRTSPTPVMVVPGTALTDVVQVKAGVIHDCARKKDGSVLCWGSNKMGQLGDGTTVSRASAAPVLGLTAVTDLATTGYHTCAVVAADVRCWGFNDWGTLGDGTKTYFRTSPTPVLW